jgi:hypothetical protein
MLGRLAIEPKDRKNPAKGADLVWALEKAANFRYRGWFNGERDGDPKKTPSDVKPHQKEFYLSEPVESFFDDHPRLVVISVPIHPAGGGEPIGVLGASIFCDTHLRKWLVSGDGNSVGSFSFALYDNRFSPPQCLVESSPSPGPFLDKEDQNAFGEYIMAPPKRLVRYRDPEDGQEYLGTFELVDKGKVSRSDPGLGLTVLIRRDLTAVEKPLAEFALQTVALGAALLAAVAGSCLIFFRYYQDKRVAHG